MISFALYLLLLTVTYFMGRMDGMEYIRRRAYPHLVNTSLTGYKNAKAILKPRS
jgi:hypothetical protein